MNAIVIDKFATAQTIAAAGTLTYTVEMERFNYNGFFSLQIVMTGTGILQAEYLLSNNGTDFVTPTGVPDSPIFTGFTVGNDMWSFEPMLSRYLRLLLTETGAANPVVVSGWLGLQ
jgi:hypothetical protein